MKELKESNGVSRISGANLLQAKQCRLPRIKWEIPSKFVLASDWYVVSGEDSEEKAVQKLRESTVLEALYHHSSTIPHNPFFPPGIENQYYDDRRTPLIPIIPIGEAEPTTVPPSNLSSVRQHPVAFHAAEGDESFAAIAAVTAIIKNIDRKSLIDTDLQIQSDPTMATKLINKYRLATDNVSIPSESNMPENAQLPQPRMSVGDALSLPVSKPSMFLSLKEDRGGHDHARNAHVAARTDPLLEKRKRDYRSPDNLQKNNNPATESLRAPFHIAKDYNAKTAVPVLKNVNYYNPLIKQHDAGTDTRDHEQSPHRNIQGNLQKPEFSNKKYQKACRYINKPEGCKTGSRCPFRHETYNQQRPNKRMKLGSAVTNQMNEQLLKEVSKKEVKTVIHQMDSNLALGPDVITNQMNEQLLKEVSKKEVKTAIFQMDSNLALGADGTMDALDQRSQLTRKKTTGEVKRAAELKGIKTLMPMVDIRKGAVGSSGSQVGKSTQPSVKQAGDRAAAGKTLKQTTLTKPPAGDNKKRAVVEEIDPARGGSGEQDTPPPKKSKIDDSQRKEVADKAKPSDKGKSVVDETVSAGTRTMVPFVGVPVGPGGCPAAWLDKEFMRQQPLDMSKATTISRGIADVPPLKHFRWGLPNPVQLEIGRGIASRVVMADQTDPRRTFLQNIEDLWGLYGATVSMVGTGLAQFINDYRSTISASVDVGKELADTKKALDAANEVGAGLRSRLSAAEAENDKLKKLAVSEKKARIEAQANSERLEKHSRELATKDVEAARTMKDMQTQIDEAQKANDALNQQLSDLNSGIEARLQAAAVDSPAADESSLHSSYHISTDASCKINEPSGLGVAVKDVDSPAADGSTLHSSCHISTDASCKIIEPSGSGVALSNVDDSPAADESSLHSSYLISTDAAWKIDKPSGLGVVIKDGNGRVLEAWSDSKHDLPSSMVAEAFALRWALSESLQRKWDNIRVISDCKTLVDYINGAGRCSYSSGCKDIGAEIILLKSNFRSCVVNFVPRSNNVHAHKLAQIGTSLTKKVCVKVLPE